MKKYKHIFFDLDHTLWDFYTNSKETLTELYDLHLTDYNFSFIDFFNKYTEVNEECWKEYRHGRMDKETLRVIRYSKAFNSFGVKDESLPLKFADDYLVRCPYKTNLIEGTVPLLESLAKKNYEMHIITNGFTEVQEIKMRECGLGKFFDKIVISEQLEYKKPHPSVFQHAMELTKTTASESLMVGDNLEADILGAKNVGMHGVYFNPDAIEHNEEVEYEVVKLMEIDEFL